MNKKQTNINPWTEEHDEFCLENHIPPSAKLLWQWLIREGIESEIEPDLSEFNEWVAKFRGKAFSHNYLKQMFQLLVDHRVVQVVKQFSWKIFRCLVRPLDWLFPKQKNLHNRNSTFNPQPSNPTSADDELLSSSNSKENLATLADEGIEFEETETEVLDRPSAEIKLAIALFKIRGGLEKILNPEGWIRMCLRCRWWESPRNFALLVERGGNVIYEMV